MKPRLPPRACLSLCLAGLAGCLPATAPKGARLQGSWAGAEATHSDTLAAGLVLHTIRLARGPWVINLLEADRGACWSPVAVKAGDQAVGRAPTSVLLRRLADTLSVMVGGAVNADFFSFEPPGIPVGAHINDGQVISGPAPNRPLVGFDRDGRAWMGVLATAGFFQAQGDSIPIAGWNQRRARGIRFFDDRWGSKTDSAARVREMAVDSSGRIVAVDTTEAGTRIPESGGVIIIDDADSSTHAERARSLRPGDGLTWRIALAPFTPVVAVGGLPILIADSAITPGLDSVGGANFGPVRHPRTAVAVRHDRASLMLVTVDGRQPGYSEGMTLAELAGFLSAIGATDAINLDGGGSTTMAVRRADGSIAVVNRPSDRTGERAVANALALVRRCRP